MNFSIPGIQRPINIAVGYYSTAQIMLRAPSLRYCILCGNRRNISAIFNRKAIKRIDQLNIAFGSRRLFHSLQSRMVNPNKAACKQERQVEHYDGNFWIEQLNKKQKTIPYNNIFQELSLTSSHMIESIEKTANLQHMLASLTSSIPPKSTSAEIGLENVNIIYRSITDLSTEESAFVLVLQCIIKTLNSKYETPTLKKCMANIKYQRKIKTEPIILSNTVHHLSLFKGDIDKIIRNPDVELSVAFLRKMLFETRKWSRARECTFDNIFLWINSLLEPSISQSLNQLVKSKFIPDIIIYDLLLRKPTNELEYKYAYELYKNRSAVLNLIDQEKMHQLRQFETHYTRELIIPPLFSNIFRYALRHQLDDLPDLIDFFLETNKQASSNLLTQLGEMAWLLSFDHSGEHINKPSRFQNIAQSSIIKVINNMIKQDKTLDIDVTMMLAVSNLSYYSNPKKAFKLFKSAKKQFDHWQLQAFKPGNFESIIAYNQPNTDVPKSFLNEIKEDYNIKFLCNSILLLFVNKDNHIDIGKDLRQIFEQVENRVLLKYPEIWNFIIIKLHYHQMISGSMYGFLLDGYCSYLKLYSKPHPFLLDVLLKDATSFGIIQPILENIDYKKLDDNNMAHIISKLYRYGPGTLEDDLKYVNPIAIARKLYEKSPFKSSRINSSYLLGEALASPHETYDRYIKMNENFKITPLTISALFISIQKMIEKDSYKTVMWGEYEPLDFALNEFDRYISKSYGDGLLFPNDHLLSVYINVLSNFDKQDRLLELLGTLVELKYPLNEKLFHRYLTKFSSWDRNELISCLNVYNQGFQCLLGCKNEFELKEKKKKLPKVRARGQFKNFITQLEMNWNIINKWKWPDKK